MGRWFSPAQQALEVHCVQLSSHLNISARPDLRRAGFTALIALVAVIVLGSTFGSF